MENHFVGFVSFVYQPEIVAEYVRETLTAASGALDYYAQLKKKRTKRHKLRYRRKHSAYSLFCYC